MGRMQQTGERKMEEKVKGWEEKGKTAARTLMELQS